MTEGQPVVSVIVPAYNVERFCEQALASAERQTLRDIEIICVNDGSTDGTLAVLSGHAARDSRIRVIDKPNGGYGSACNCGIEAARGTWVAILEPDDWIEPGMFADMTAFADSLGVAVDIVKTPYWRVIDPDTENERWLNCSYKGRIRPARQPFSLSDAHVDHLLIHHPSIWSALYRRSFLDEFGIRFLEIPGAGWADNPFVVETLCQARAIAYLDRAYYCYREETADKTATFARDNAEVPFARWHDMMDVLERIGERRTPVLAAQFRRGFTYLDYIGEGIELGDPRVRDVMERLFARMDDDIVLAEPHIPPAWKRRYCEVKGIGRRRVSAVPYAATLVGAGLYSLRNVGLAETFNLIGSVARRDRAAEGAGTGTGAGSGVDAEPVADRARDVDKNISLSVIIPVYNAERYLGECLDSLACQTYGRFEVVCVNDGSTDGSRELLERRAARDGRIRIVDQPNGGPSSARNAGIRAASGDYACFLDADDSFEPDACRRLLEEASDGAPDIIAFGWTCVPKVRANRWLSELTRVRDARYERFEPAILFEEKTIPYLRCAVRRELLARQGVSFDETLRIGEDCAFLLALYPRANAVRLVSDRIYRYRLPHEGSVMSDTREGAPGKCVDDVAMMISVLGDWGRSGLLERYGADLMHWFVVIQLYTILRLDPPVRDEVVALARQMWLAQLSADELRALSVPEHDRALVNIMLSAHEDGSLAIGERELARAMFTWRNAEYGLGDLFHTALERLRQ